MLDSSDAVAGDTITLTVNEVMPCEGGFVATISPEGSAPKKAKKTEPMEEMGETEEPTMSPMAKKVLGKGKK